MVKVTESIFFNITSQERTDSMVNSFQLAKLMKREKSKKIVK